MKRILQIIFLALVVLVVLVVIGGGAAYWFVTKSHPQVDGVLRVKGVKGRVEIIRDSMGVPHIYASNVDDLFFANGYVHAQDRLWQMEFNRRVGHGTLSEVLGASTLDRDRFLRTLGLARAARADLPVHSDDTRRVLQAYANGVNAFVETHRDNLPLEFDLLGFKPAPWEPVDTIVWGKVMALSLSGQYEYELARARLVEQVGAAKTAELLPPYPATGPFIIPSEAKEHKSQLPISNLQSPISNLQSPISNLQSQTSISIGAPDLDAIARLNAALGLWQPGVGSNNWVIGGAKTTTGKPILASDQHLSIQMPAIWYQVGLHCVPQTTACPYNVAGVGFPGVPGVVVGHNDRIAWGVTNVGPDVQDFYVEEIRGGQYKFKDKWEDLHIVEETIKVKGGASETLRVQITRHGPIMTPVLPGVTAPLALQWTALRDRGALMESVLMLNRAQNWDEFRDALRLWDAPSQNFVYADVEGNIGYQAPGKIPIRARGDGLLPASGASGEYEWTGYIPFDELPSVFNPPTHFVVTANNAVVPTTYKYHLSYYWASPHRAQRISDLIKAKDKLSVDDVKAIQGDVYSIPLAHLQKHVVALKPEGIAQARALEHVKAWDGFLTTGNIGGTILEATYQRLARNTFADDLKDAGLVNTYLGAGGDYSRRVMQTLLDQPNSDWWDDVTTAPRESRDEMLKKSYAEAVEWLRRQFGDDPGEWRWGRLHTATFAHPLGSVPPLDRLLNAGPVGVPGGVFTVFATQSRVGTYAASSITSQRQIIDLANFANSWHVLTTGQSGQPLHKHHSDNVLLWRDVKYTPYHFDRAAVSKAREGVLILAP